MSPIILHPNLLDNLHNGQSCSPSFWPYLMSLPSLLSPWQSAHSHCSHMSNSFVIIHWKIFQRNSKINKVLDEQKRRKLGDPEVTGRVWAKFAPEKDKVERKQGREIWCVQLQNRNDFRIHRVTGNMYVPIWFI